jgi:hypothetical protein
MMSDPAGDAESWKNSSTGPDVPGSADRSDSPLTVDPCAAPRPICTVVTTVPFS